MFQSLDECISAWKEAGKHGDKQTRVERNRLWIEYYSYLAEQADEDANDPFAEEIADDLAQKKIITPESTVIDIGAGTGNFTAAFAKRCKSVTALEMDAASVGIIENRAKHNGLQNITCENRMWEDFSSPQKYSVAFSSMCPAVSDYEELLKMESLAEEACCLIAVTRGSYDLHRKKLMELFSVKPQGGMTTEALWYYEVLYLLGKQPDVKNSTRQFRYSLPIDECIRRNEIYFRIFGIPDSQSRPVLRRYFEAIAENGLVADETHLNTALITWKVR